MAKRTAWSRWRPTDNVKGTIDGYNQNAWIPRRRETFVHTRAPRHRVTAAANATARVSRSVGFRRRRNAAPNGRAWSALLGEAEMAPEPVKSEIAIFGHVDCLGKIGGSRS